MSKQKEKTGKIKLDDAIHIMTEALEGASVSIRKYAIMARRFESLTGKIAISNQNHEGHSR